MATRIKKKYRLQALLVIKERAKRRCEIELAKAIKALKEEEERLEQLEEEKRKIEERIEKERRDMHSEVAAGQAKMKDPQLRLNFLRKLQEDLEEKEEEIENQKEVVNQAKQRVARCRQDYILAVQDLDVMEKHKELWEKKELKQITAAENKVMDELGQTIHQMTQANK